MSTGMTIEKRFIKNLQGKDFVLYAGLVDLAHRIGLDKIETELLRYDGEEAICKARVSMTDGSIFEGIGDANTKNVNALIAKHKIRMAETRAKARALRDACNVDLCTVEELGGDDEPAAPPQEKQDPYYTYKVKSGEMAGKSFNEITNEKWLNGLAEKGNNFMKPMAIRRLKELEGKK